MTEQEWLNSTDAQAMLAFLRRSSPARFRKLRLFIVACCRLLWPLLADKPYRHAVDVAERFADGLASPADLAAAEDAAGRVAMWGSDPAVRIGPQWEAGWYVEPAGGARALAAQYDAPAVLARAAATADVEAAALLCVPWAAALGADSATQAMFVRDIMHAPHRPVYFKSCWRCWNDGTVAKMARLIYEQRVLGRTPLLADALEEAGCTEADLLSHLRGAGPHVKGCWAVDLVLGKS